MDLRMRPKAFSAAYFSVLDALPELRPIVRELGRVVVVGRDVTIQVGPDGEDELDRRALTRVVDRFKIRQAARPLMSELSQAFKETINLGYLDGSKVLHIDKIDSPEVLRMDSLLGSRAPAYCTALGKSILAFLPDAERDRILDTIELKPRGPKTITSKKALQKELAKIRHKGYAVDNEELSKGLRCVAAPIFDHTGMSCFSISVAGPVSRETRSRVKEIQKQVRRVCRTLSQEFGNRTSDDS